MLSSDMRERYKDRDERSETSDSQQLSCHVQENLHDDTVVVYRTCHPSPRDNVFESFSCFDWELNFPMRPIST